MDRRSLAHAPLERQVAGLEELVLANPVARVILGRAPLLGVRSWYLGASGVTQSVWNQMHGFDPAQGIKDYDLVYFDEEDRSDAGLEAVRVRAANLWADVQVVLDVQNEARVHLWYGTRFGRQIEPYVSTEQAIASWPTTASSVGVRYDSSHFAVCAPFGLSDVFAMVVRPNKAIVDRAVYEEKAERWARRWPMLTVIPWDRD